MLSACWCSPPTRSKSRVLARIASELCCSSAQRPWCSASTPRRRPQIPERSAGFALRVQLDISGHATPTSSPASMACGTPCSTPLTKAYGEPLDAHTTTQSMARSVRYACPASAATLNGRTGLPRASVWSDLVGMQRLRAPARRAHVEALVRPRPVALVHVGVGRAGAEHGLAAVAKRRRPLGDRAQRHRHGRIRRQAGEQRDRRVLVAVDAVDGGQVLRRRGVGVGIPRVEEAHLVVRDADALRIPRDGGARPLAAADARRPRAVKILGAVPTHIGLLREARRFEADRGGGRNYGPPHCATRCAPRHSASGLSILGTWRGS